MVMCSEPVMRAPFRGWGSEFLADRHQARHFGFGDLDFLVAPVGQLDVGDDVVLGGLVVMAMALFTPSFHEKPEKSNVSAVARRPAPVHRFKPGRVIALSQRSLRR
jgi:hypothetical protein